jgi:hypothetical protein
MTKTFLESRGIQTLELLEWTGGNPSTSSREQTHRREFANLENMSSQ